MAFTKITDADLQGKGVVGQAPVPGLPVKEMQESVEQIVREVAIPGINRLADELSAQTAAKNIGMQVPDGMPGGASANVSSVVGTHVLSTGNPHKVTAEQVGAYTKEQTDQAINQKVQDIGAGDMSKSEYARTGTYGAVDRALSADRAVQSDDGVKVYTHTKSGTVHNFAGSGANGRALMTADVEAGDTFTVNGAPVTAYMGADDATSSMADRPWNGKWVSFIVGDKTLNFNGGSSKMLLWSNENPYATFDAQEVTLDLSGFSHVIIDFVMRVTEFNECSVMVPSDCFQVVHQIEQYYSDYRKVTVSKSSVSFGPGGWYDISGKADHNDNGYMVPKRIYGVR